MNILKLLLFLIVISFSSCTTVSKEIIKEPKGNQAQCIIDEKLSIELVNEYRRMLSQFLSEPENIPLKEIGILYFYIGVETNDRDSIKKAMDIFKKILEEKPDNAEIKAFMGSSYTVKARDFPLKWIASVTPLGFIRLHYVKKGIDMMDEAVEIDGMNPITRITRGITCITLPGIFQQFKKGIEDIELLLSWIENPSLNEEYSEIITDKYFMATVYYRTGEGYLKEGKKEKALSLFKKASSINFDNPFSRAAERMLNKITDKDENL